MITRTVMARIAAQSFDSTGAFITPIIFTAKILLSHSCTICGIHELDEEIFKKDPKFSAKCVNFIKCLKRIDEIIPFERKLVPLKGKLRGLV